MKIKLFSALIVFVLMITAGAQAIENIPKDTKIEMRRTGCFGTCPIYTVIIYSDGKVIFDGEKYVESIGFYTKNISLNKVSELLNEFNKIKFLTISELSCEYSVTDHDGAHLSLTVDGKSNTLKIDHGCGGNQLLSSLIALENKIDVIAGSAEWIGLKDDYSYYEVTQDDEDLKLELENEINSH